MSASEVDISDVVRGFHLMAARSTDLRPVLRQVRAWLKPEIERHFDEQAGPTGAWAPRARTTIERARERRGFVRKRGKRAGQMTKRGAKWNARQLGRFRNVGAYLFRMDSQTLTMEARGKWSGIHQTGGVAGHGARIPARPYLWVSDDLVERFQRAVIVHVTEGLRR